MRHKQNKVFAGRNCIQLQKINVAKIGVWLKLLILTHIET